MYEQHWHLKQPAFRCNSSAEFFFPGRAHDAALLKLRYLVEQRQGIAVVTGSSGMGKSCVLNTFCESLPSHYGPIVHVLFPQLTSAELLGYLVAKLESFTTSGPTTHDGIDHLLQRLEHQLLQLTKSGRHPLIIIDDAHLIGDRRVFQTLQLLLNYRRANQIEFSVILAGQPELVGQLKRYAALHERLAFVSTVVPFDATETAAYVQHRVRSAGGSTGIFEPDALATIYRLSGGSPRRINRLCDFALLVGYADNLDQITPAEIEAVAEELALVA